MTAPLLLTERDQARFFAKAALPNEQGCMLWLAAKDGDGYGWFGLNGKTRRAHRVAYVLAYGPIPDGLVIDHLCRTPACVRPDHLEPVTNTENLRRGIGSFGAGAWQRSKTHCPQGHPYSGENLYTKASGSRECRACHRAANERYRARKKVPS